MDRDANPGGSLVPSPMNRDANPGGSLVAIPNEQGCKPRWESGGAPQ